MISRISKIHRSWLVPLLLVVSSLGGCAHGLGLKMESARVARELGFAGCDVTEPLTRSQVLEAADRIGNPDLAASPEWSAAISMMQPGDDLRRVFCRSNKDNFFGLFRSNTLLTKFGGMIYD